MQTCTITTAQSTRAVSIRRCLRGLAVAGFLVGMGNAAQAAVLYGVTGDGAPTPETFYRVSVIDASTVFVQTLGNGDDGESIACRPADTLMYHWSGIFGSSVMETINLNNQAVTNVPTDVTSYNPAEVQGSTYDPSNDVFLFTDGPSNLGSVTPGGTFTLIGGLPHTARGLAFNGGALYAGDKNGDQLREINPVTGAQVSQVTVTLAGFSVLGINSLSTDPQTGILYAVLKTASGPTSRRLVSLNPLTGTATDIGSLPDGFANIEFDCGAVPVPALTLPGLISFGVMLLGAMYFTIRRRTGAKI